MKIKLLFLLALFGSMTASIHAGDIFSRYSYPNIINLQDSYLARNKQVGLFSDMGAWMGFSLPADKSLKGFTGPFSIEKRTWGASSLLCLDDNAMSVDSMNYFPGELYLRIGNQKGRVEERLCFVSHTTALLRIDNTTGKRLTMSSLGIGENLKMKIEGNRVVLQSPNDEWIIITLPKNSIVKEKDSAYIASIGSSIKQWITIQFVYDAEALSHAFTEADGILHKAETCWKENDTRWDGYLRSVLRQDMPMKYNRIAVKSVATLISNWRHSRRGLLHDGIVPSCFVDYFVGCWAWDSWRFSVAMAKFAPEVAKDNIRVMFDYQKPDGMIIDCVFPDTAKNNARDSKPPLATWAVDKVYEATGDTAFLREMFPKLLKYHKWWYEKRDHDHNGMCEFGSVDGTREAAAWESGMDNAVRFDSAKMIRNGADAWSLNQESVDLNVYLAYEYMLLKKMATILHEPFDMLDYTAAVVDYFFDKGEGFFFDRRLGSGEFMKQPGCEGYLPFWARIASKEQFEKARRLLDNPKKFSTFIPFPTLANDYPTYKPDDYWRGSIWLDQTYYGISAYRNYGLCDKADEYTRQVFDRLYGLTADSPICENYDPNNGKPYRASNFSWSAAHLLMLYWDYGLKN